MSPRIQIDVRIARHPNGMRFVETVSVENDTVLDTVGPFDSMAAAEAAAQDVLKKLMGQGGRLESAGNRPLN